MITSRHQRDVLLMVKESLRLRVDHAARFQVRPEIAHRRRDDRVPELCRKDVLQGRLYVGQHSVGVAVGQHEPRYLIAPRTQAAIITALEAHYDPIGSGGAFGHHLVSGTHARSIRRRLSDANYILIIAFLSLPSRIGAPRPDP